MTSFHFRCAVDIVVQVFFKFDVQTKMTPWTVEMTLQPSETEVFQMLKTLQLQSANYVLKRKCKLENQFQI